MAKKSKLSKTRRAKRGAKSNAPRRKNDNLQIKVDLIASGTGNEIARALRKVARELAQGEHLKYILEKGNCEWEDETLFGEVTLAE